jgi:DNA-binding MarR family transcriptional regulator
VRSRGFADFDCLSLTGSTVSDVDLTALVESLFDALAALFVAMRRESFDRLVSGGSTLTQIEILAALVDKGPLRLGELAALEQHQASSTSATTMRMQRKGLLRRVPDPTDRRAVQVEVTRKGVAAYRSSVASKLVARLSAFTDAELHQLKRAVPVFARIADENMTQ